jgi:hypothetical protein
VEPVWVCLQQPAALHRSQWAVAGNGLGWAQSPVGCARGAAASPEPGELGSSGSGRGDPPAARRAGLRRSRTETGKRRQGCAKVLKASESLASLPNHAREGTQLARRLAEGGIRDAEGQALVRRFAELATHRARGGVVVLGAFDQN